MQNMFVNLHQQGPLIRETSIAKHKLTYVEEWLSTKQINRKLSNLF